jgi:hypothetical protein
MNPTNFGDTYNIKFLKSGEHSERPVQNEVSGRSLITKKIGL